MKIAIAAAAGNIGSRTARKIAAAGAELILLGRSLDKLTALEIDESISVETDVSDDQSMVKATAGAEALLCLVPQVMDRPNLKEWYAQVASAASTAVRANKIRRVVLVSSLGAGSGKDDLGTVSYAGQMEETLGQLGINLVSLRPGYFMENFLAQAGLIQSEGFFTFTYAPDHDIPFISTNDIGDVAAEYLLDDNWTGQPHRNLMGPENIALPQAARIISEVLNKPVTYRQASMESVRQQLSDFGAPPTVQQELIDLFVALGDADGAYATPRTTEAFTPTTFKQFVETKLLLAIGIN